MSVLDSIPLPDKNISSDEFYKVSFDYLTLLREKAAENGQIAVTSDHDAAKFRGDLYGLLSKLGVQRDLLPLTARVNGFMSSSDYDGEILHFLLVDISFVKQLVTIMRTKVRN